MSTDSLDTLAARMQHITYTIIRSYELCDQWVIVPHGLTVSQGYTLLTFHPQEAVSMSDLSESMGLANSTMTRMVDQLVRRGLVQRKPDDRDRRVILVGLTSKGREVRSALEMEFQEFFKLVLQEIEEEERSAVLDAMEKMFDAVGKVASACEL